MFGDYWAATVFGNRCPGMSRIRCRLRLPNESAKTSANMKGAEDMKYILMGRTTSIPERNYLMTQAAHLSESTGR